MNEPPTDEAAGPRAEEEAPEEDWAAEIRRLRAARGQRLAERLAEEPETEPPVDP